MRWLAQGHTVSQRQSQEPYSLGPQASVHLRKDPFLSWASVCPFVKWRRRIWTEWCQRCHKPQAPKVLPHLRSTCMITDLKSLFKGLLKNFKLPSFLNLFFGKETSKNKEKFFYYICYSIVTAGHILSKTHFSERVRMQVSLAHLGAIDSPLVPLAVEGLCYGRNLLSVSCKSTRPDPATSR